MTNIKGIMLGAVVGTLAGTLGAALLPNRDAILKAVRDQGLEWADQATRLGENVYDEINNFKTPHENNVANFTNGAFVGLLLGAGTALLLAPASGKDLRKNISKQYRKVADKAEEFVHVYQNKAKRAVRKATRHSPRRTKAAR